MNRLTLALTAIGLFVVASFGIALAIVVGAVTLSALVAARAVRALTAGRGAAEADNAGQNGIRRVWNDGRGTIIDM